jgi:antitoxin YefM
MVTYSVDAAKHDLEGLITQTSQAHRPVVITTPQRNAVLLAEDDWNSIQETLYLVSIPGMRDSIREGMNTPVDECDEELDW